MYECPEIARSLLFIDMDVPRAESLAGAQLVHSRERMSHAFAGVTLVVHDKPLPSATVCEQIDLLRRFLGDPAGAAHPSATAMARCR